MEVILSELGSYKNVFDNQDEFNKLHDLILGAIQNFSEYRQGNITYGEIMFVMECVLDNLRNSSEQDLQSKKTIKGNMQPPSFTTLMETMARMVERMVKKKIIEPGDVPGRFPDLRVHDDGQHDCRRRAHHRPEGDHHADEQHAHVDGNAGRRCGQDRLGQGGCINKRLRNREDALAEQHTGQRRDTHLQETKRYAQHHTEAEQSPTCATLLLCLSAFAAEQQVLGSIAVQRLVRLGQSHRPLGLNGRQGEGQAFDIAGQPKEEIAQRVAVEQAQEDRPCQ